jgi:hypothetical protein
MKMNIPKFVHTAIGVLLTEFGNCDLGPRLDHLRSSDLAEDILFADKLEDAFELVEQWWKQQADKAA